MARRKSDQKVDQLNAQADNLTARLGLAVQGVPDVGLATDNPDRAPTAEEMFKSPWLAFRSSNYLYDLAPAAVAHASELFTGQPYKREGLLAEEDPNFKWTPELLETYTAGIDEADYDYILEAESEEEAKARRDRLTQINQDRATLGRMGLIGTSLQIATSLVDPTILLPFGSGFAAKGRTLERMIDGGVFGAATAGGSIALSQASSAVDDHADALTVLSLGFGLGAGVGAVRGVAQATRDFLAPLVDPRAKFALALEDAAVRSRMAAAEAAGAKLTEEGKGFFANARDRLKAMLGIDGADGLFGNSSVGAAEAKGSIQSLRADPITGDKAFDQLFSVDDAAFSFGGRLRIDTVGRLKQSKNPVVRSLASLLDVDSVGIGAAGEKANLGTATERARRHVNVALGEAAVGMDAVFDTWAKRQGLTVIGRLKERRNFYARVMEYIRSKGTLPDAGGELAQAAQVWRQSMKQGLQRMKEAGVRGADDVADDDWYVPRIWRSEKIEAAISKYGLEKVEGMLAGALRSAWRKQPGDAPRLPGNIVEGEVVNEARIGQRFADDVDDLPKDTADKIAKAMLARIRRLGAGLEASGFDAFRVNRDHLDEILADAGVAAEQRASILERINPSKGADGEPNMARLKQRTLLDDGYSEVVTPREGNLGELLSINDLLDDDLARVLGSYHSNVAGYSAMSEAFGVQSFQEFERRVREVAGHVGAVRDYTAAEAKADINRLLYLGKRIYGVPVEDLTTPFARGAKAVRDWNFARNMGQAGAANLADISVVIAETGLEVVRRHIPGVFDAIRAMREGRAVEGLDKDLGTLLGVGRHGKRNDIIPAYEDLDEMLLMHSATGDWISRIGRVAEQSSRVVGKFSGFEFVMDFLQMTAARGATQHIYDVVNAVRRPAGANVPDLVKTSDNIEVTGFVDRPGPRISDKRAAAYGLEEADFDAFSKLFRHMETDANGTVTRLNYDKMRAEDPAAFQRFVDYLDRRVRMMVLEPTPGMLHEVYGTTVGKIFLQFRAFPFASTFAHGMQMVALRDKAAMMKGVYGMATAGMIFALQTNIRSLGRSDAQEYRDKRLNFEEIAKAAYQRSSFAGLTPSLIDTAAGFVSDKPVFAYGRTTELGSGFVAGNPTVDLLFNDIPSALYAPGQSAVSDARQYAEADARNAVGLLPLQNALGFQTAANILISAFPDERRQAAEEQP